MSKFQRPADLPFPLVYRVFEAPDAERRENAVEYRVQDLLESDYECAVELMVRDFASEESLCLCRGLRGDAEAVEEIKHFWREALNGKISLGCYNSNGELVGVTVLAVHVKNFEEAAFEFKTDVVKDILSALYFIETQYDVFAEHNVDKYLTDYGMVTHRDFRQRGIASEILKARNQLMKSLNLRVSSGAFTVIGSQKAALKTNYTESFAIKWPEVGEKFPAFDFSLASVDHCKIMSHVD